MMKNIDAKESLKAFTVILCLLLCGLTSCDVYGQAESDEPYGGLAEEDYLAGRFDPSRHPQFTEISSMGIPTNGKKLYLRRETATALQRLYCAFHTAHPSAKFYVRSATRNWDDQKAIWEDKWNGRTPVEGKALNRELKQDRERSLKILEYSSMPGTSRHHWGTDFDLNELNNAYYESGDGTVLYRWLVRHACGYGFCRPYTAGRKAGYQEEKWHWSYRATAKRYLHDWEKVFGEEAPLSRRGWSFDGAREAEKLAPLYVSVVADQCR